MHTVTRGLRRVLRFVRLLSRARLDDHSFQPILGHSEAPTQVSLSRSGQESPKTCVAELNFDYTCSFFRSKNLAPTKLHQREGEMNYTEANSSADGPKSLYQRVKTPTLVIFA